MAIDFPDSPATNDTYTDSGKTWKYNGYAWVLQTIPTALANGSIALTQLAQGGATTGQALVWSGSAWAPHTALRDNLIKFYMEVI